MSRQQMSKFKTLLETYHTFHLTLSVLQSLEVRQSLKLRYMSNIKHCVLYFYHLPTHLSLQTISLLSQT